MTEETEGPVEEGLSNEEAVGMVAAMMGGGNSKPDTAEGVANMMNRAVEFVEEHSRTSFGALPTHDFSEVPVSLNPRGGFEFIDQRTLDSYSDNPRFRKGTATITSLASFIDHVNRFGDEDSAVFARDDRDNPGLLAVLDYHRKDTLICAIDDDSDEYEGSTRRGEFRHGWHRTAFDFPVSDEWQAWTGQNGEAMSMTEFAQFLEDNVLDVAEMGDDIPESAERFVEMCGGKKNIADWSMLTKLAKSLSVFESATVTQVTDLHGGAVNLTINEEHDTEVDGIKAEVPTMFFIAIPIFRDGAYYRLPVRLRYRKTRGNVVFFYEMWRHDRAFMEAVKDAVDKVATETQAQVFYGKPE